MWPLHGPTHNIYLEAPDAYTAREYALRMCPEQKVIGIRRIEDLKRDGLA
jgi:hypothetical protein